MKKWLKKIFTKPLLTGLTSRLQPPTTEKRMARLARNCFYLSSYLSFRWDYYASRLPRQN